MYKDPRLLTQKSIHFSQTPYELILNMASKDTLYELVSTPPSI